MLSIDEEYDRATRRAAFSNGFEGESWMSAWCEECVHYDTCPLLAVALLGRTPRQWTEVHPRGLAERYTCAEFTE